MADEARREAWLWLMGRMVPGDLPRGRDRLQTWTRGPEPAGRASPGQTTEPGREPAFRVRAWQLRSLAALVAERNGVLAVDPDADPGAAHADCVEEASRLGLTESTTVSLVGRRISYDCSPSKLMV